MPEQTVEFQATTIHVQRQGTYQQPTEDEVVPTSFLIPVVFGAAVVYYNMKRRFNRTLFNVKW